MITVYQYLPAWTVPCISPYVTKVIYYMRMAGIEFQTKRQNLTALDQDSPTGKLPYIVDGDCKIADSTQIIGYLKKQYGDSLDDGVSTTDLAVMHAWNRLIDEHLYWVAVIQPRWRETANWEMYLRIIADGADISPGLRAFADDFRFRILNEFMNGGWGRMRSDEIYARAQADIDALSDFLGRKVFLMGEQPRSIDASVLSSLRHIIDSPFEFELRHYAAEKHNLVEYMGRMKRRFDI